MRKMTILVEVNVQDEAEANTLCSKIHRANLHPRQDTGNITWLDEGERHPGEPWGWSMKLYEKRDQPRSA